jgi:hypothetical protein
MKQSKEEKMKKRLLCLAAFLVTLALQYPRPAAALPPHCYAENYGSGQCGTTCVWYNDQGSVEGWATDFFRC